MYFNKKLSFITALTVIFIALCFTLGAFKAEATPTAESTIKDLAVTPNYRYLQDKNYNTSANTNNITLSSDTPIDSVYVVFWSEAVNYTISSGEASFKVENPFLHSFTKLPDDLKGATQLSISFDKSINVSDVSAFAEGELPDWVHVWEQPYDKADILLDSTHADDEQLFFAGILPYHVAKGYRVQVVYLTDHNTTPGRRHELLNGLWTVGVNHYPIIGNVPDAYSTTYDGAVANAKWSGYSVEKIIGFQTEMLRRFKPQVVVGHDLNGEYSHGQHMLNIRTLITAVEGAANPENYPESAEKYGVWDTPKLYVHLYKENEIVLNWDEPLDYFGGKSAFQMSQAGYKQHDSQQYTWFTDWLNGNGTITKASQIKTYSPCLFGLYRSTVGEDIEKNSFFENLISYDEQYRLEQERLEQERLEKEEQKRREEEESRKAAEESRRLEEESIAESIRIAESEREESERLQQLKEEQNDKYAMQKRIIAFIILVSAVILLVVIILKKRKR